MLRNLDMMVCNSCFENKTRILMYTCFPAYIPQAACIEDADLNSIHTKIGLTKSKTVHTYLSYVKYSTWSVIFRRQQAKAEILRWKKYMVKGKKSSNSTIASTLYKAQLGDSLTYLCWRDGGPYLLVLEGWRALLTCAGGMEGQCLAKYLAQRDLPLVLLRKLNILQPKLQITFELLDRSLRIQQQQ